MSAQRVLLVRVGAMGDVLHALPAVAGLRQQWPDAVVDWVVAPQWAPLLQNENGQGPLVSGVHPADTRLWSRAPLSRVTVHSIAALRRALRAARYDFVIDVQGTLRSAVIGRMAGGAALAGFADPREALARPLYRQRLPRQGTHVVEQNAALVGEALAGVLAKPLAPGTPALPVSAAAEAWCDRSVGHAGAGDRLALLAPSAGWVAKQWPVERFAELASSLSASGFRVLINAAPGQDALAADMRRCCAGPVEMVVCDLPQLIELTRRVAVVVCGDSGPLHLAAALGRPVVALFGPTDPARNGPWGPGPAAVLRNGASVTSYKRSAVPDPGLLRISVAEVLAAVHAVTARDV